MRFLCAFSVSLFLLGSISPQGRGDTDFLAPTRPGLVAVHWPNLSQLESEVREQIKSHQDVLIATVKDPGSSDHKLSIAYGTLGEIYHAYSLNAPAQQCYQNASRLAPKDFRWVYLLAKLEHLQGRVEEAIQHYQVAISLQPANVATLINLGNLYLELDRLEQASACFAQALQKVPNNAAAHYGLGQVALSKRNYAEAVEHLEKALALVPEANRIHYPLALAYRGLGNTEKAKAHLTKQGTVGVRVADSLLDRLVELVQGGRVHMIRGKLALEGKRYEEAAAEFRKAIEAEPESATPYVNLGAALTQLKDLKGAAEQFERALNIDRHNVTAHFNLAVLLANDNQHPQAIKHLQAVLTTNANDLGARMFLAQELSKASRVDEAIVEFSRVVESDSNNETAAIALAQLLQSKGEFRAALDGLEKAHTQYPQKVKTTALLAYVLASSPQLNLRDGPRALKLARSLYSITASLQHGTLVVLALAEMGNCAEAMAWQRKLIAEARNEEQLERLKADLRRYENVKSCRP